MDAYFGDMDPLQMQDPELENRLKECETDEEKDKVIKESISLRLLILITTVVSLLFATIVIGGIIYLFE